MYFIRRVQSSSSAFKFQGPSRGRPIGSNPPRHQPAPTEPARQIERQYSDMSSPSTKQVLEQNYERPAINNSLEDLRQGNLVAQTKSMFSPGASQSQVSKTSQAPSW